MKLYDIPRFYTALAECLSVLYASLILKRRVTGWRFIICFLGFAVLQSVFLVLTANVPLFLWIPCMVLAVSFMALFIRGITTLDWISAIYHTMFAFVCAEFLAAVEQLPDYYLLEGYRDYSPPRLLLMAAVYAVIMFILYFLKPFMEPWQEEDQRVSIREMLVVLFTALLVFTVSNIGIVLRKAPMDGPLAEDIMIIRALTDLGGMAILFAYHVALGNLKREREYLLLSQVLQQQYEQYRTFQQSIEMINIKYHDLKHQIAGMKAEIDPARKAEWVDRLEQEVSEYRPERQTGHTVLDTVIAGKSMDIQKNKINFTCVCDGAALAPIHVSDICTIFGNALDNAIEHLTMVEDPDKRMIHLEVFEKNGFIFIMMVNNCDREVKMQNGLPVTTRKDRREHGYGVKSILRTAEKYGGTATFSWKDGLFEMKVLIPVR